VRFTPAGQFYFLSDMRLAPVGQFYQQQQSNNNLNVHFVAAILGSSSATSDFSVGDK
jgi:hypothetical protein